MGADGALYGVTNAGGVYGQGSVFQLTPPGSGGTWTESDLYSFTGASDGGNPEALIMNENGGLYGTTFNGGIWGAGTVYELRPPAVPGRPWTENVLYSFTGGADGSNPWNFSLTASDGILYGTTRYGGAFGYGTVFQLQPPAGSGGPWTETVLFSFSQGHGEGPNSPLIVRDGNIYGTTSLMYTGDPILGSFGAGGLLFELRKPAAPGGPWTEIGVHPFHNDDIPYGSLFIDNNGSLYGTTIDSNAYPWSGYLYKITR